jgi:hypothetical protein
LNKFKIQTTLNEPLLHIHTSFTRSIIQTCIIGTDAIIADVFRPKIMAPLAEIIFFGSIAVFLFFLKLPMKGVAQKSEKNFFFKFSDEKTFKSKQK